MYMLTLRSVYVPLPFSSRTGMTECHGPWRASTVSLDREPVDERSLGHAP